MHVRWKRLAGSNNATKTHLPHTELFGLGCARSAGQIACAQLRQPADAVPPFRRHSPVEETKTYVARTPGERNLVRALEDT
jgi:hypothetical protein